MSCSLTLEAATSLNCSGLDSYLWKQLGHQWREANPFCPCLPVRLLAQLLKQRWEIFVIALVFLLLAEWRLGITLWAIFLDSLFKQPIINLIYLEEEIQKYQKLCTLNTDSNMAFLIPVRAREIIQLISGKTKCHFHHQSENPSKSSEKKWIKRNKIYFVALGYSIMSVLWGICRNLQSWSRDLSCPLFHTWAGPWKSVGLSNRSKVLQDQEPEQQY